MPMTGLLLAILQQLRRRVTKKSHCLRIEIFYGNKTEGISHMVRVKKRAAIDFLRRSGLG
jgi:hypothetical protein